jgi:hypothetical protein
MLLNRFLDTQIALDVAGHLYLTLLKFRRL